MKKIFLLQVILALLCLHGSSSYAQITIAADCVDRIDVLSIPAYPTTSPNAWISSAGLLDGGSPCRRDIAIILKLAHPIGWLEQKVGGSWISMTPIGSPVTLTVPMWFNKLSHGTYRVRMRGMELFRYDNQCPNGVEYWLNGNKAGYQVVPSTIDQYSNEVIIGSTTPAESDFSFISNGSGSVNVYDYLDNVSIDARASVNYDQYWIAIAENGGANRWASYGWVAGQIPYPFDLTKLWKDGHGSAAEFEVGISYTVQVTPTVNHCPLWASVKEKDFFVCPYGSGCKGIQTPKTQAPVTVGNSANQLNVFNLDFSAQKLYTVNVISVDGRIASTTTLATNQPIDISGLVAGLYVVKVSSAGKLICTGKLVK